MFNPRNLDEVCVWATQLEARGKKIQEEGSKKKSFKGNKKERVGKWKGKKNARVKKEGEKLHANIVRKRGMVKPIIGNYILN